MTQSTASPTRNQTELLLSAAQEYDRNGFVMTPTKGKAAYRPGWQTDRLTLEEIAEIFSESRLNLNLGVLLGKPSRWLIDIDLDHPAASELADQFLPPTGAIFGRKSKPRSHRLYYVTAPISTIQHRLPADGKKGGAMVVELRSTGGQTVFPPSRHPSGETIKWSATESPAEIAPDELADAVAKLAAAVREKLGLPVAGTTDRPQSPPPTRNNGHSRATYNTTRDMAHIIDRAAKYLSKLPPAVSGQGGHRATFRAANVLVNGFDLSIDDACCPLADWNQTCQPPWSDAELRHKLDDAAKESVPRGYLLTESASATAPRNGNGKASGYASGGGTTGTLVTPLATGTRVRCGDRGNIGDVVSDDGGPTVRVHFRSKDGTEAEKDIDRDDVRTADGQPVGGDVPPRTPILRYTMREMAAAYPRLDPPVIDGLLREREILNHISSAKIGKSWMAYYVLLCMATGRPIFNRFATTARRVLLLDNELPPALLPYRVKTVADALGIEPHEYEDMLTIWSLRHSPRSVYDLREEFKDVPPAAFQLVVIDAKYKALGDGDENSNSDEGRFYAEAGVLAETIQSALWLVHHSTKGSQSDKRVVDVGAGGSAQARAADTHLVLREHEQPDCCVMSAALRSFAPVEPLALRWRFPCWELDDSLDPDELKGRKSSQQSRDAEAESAILAACPIWRTKTEIQKITGYGDGRLVRILGRLVKSKQLETGTEDRPKNPNSDVYRAAK